MATQTELAKMLNDGIEKNMAMRHTLVNSLAKEFLDRTGLDVAKVELCEQHGDDVVTRLWFRERQPASGQTAS